MTSESAVLDGAAIDFHAMLEHPRYCPVEISVRSRV